MTAMNNKVKEFAANKHRKKPVEVEAVQWTGENLGDLYVWGANMELRGEGMTLYIHTLEGDMRASIGDYIIKGVKGEFYACKPDIFEMTYESATDTNVPTTRTNWDVLIEDKALLAEVAIKNIKIFAEGWIAVLDRSRHTTCEAAIAANLAWLDAEATP